MKLYLALFFCLFLFSGCADHYGNIRGDFYAPRVERELNFYVATHPFYSTNHFFVGALVLQGTNMDSGMVYWKEGNMLLPYDELRPDATEDIFAWQHRALKLGRDTVNSEADLNGSTYMITTANWHDWVNQCSSKGKRYIVLRSDAGRMFPNAVSESDE